jgi:hypothetical protein
MDILIASALVAIMLITGFHLTMWVREKYAITSSHLRSAVPLLICLTLLVFALFGARLYLKPEVRIEYNDKLYDLFSSQSLNDKGQFILESKKIVGCEVELTKSYPLMWRMGRDVKQIKFKMPCEHLLPEMKTEVSNVTSFLKEEKQ